MKWKTLDLYIMNFSKINLQSREWIKKLNINHFWDLSFLICNAVLEELPNYTNNSLFWTWQKLYRENYQMSDVSF